MQPKELVIDAKVAQQALITLYNMRPCFENPSHHFTAYNSQHGCFDVLNKFLVSKIREDEEKSKQKDEDFVTAKEVKVSEKSKLMGNFISKKVEEYLDEPSLS